MRLLNAMLHSERRRYLLSIYTLMMIIECLASLEIKELRVPAHAAAGTKAQLSCEWELSPADTLYSVKWYKDGKEFYRYVPRDLEPMRKFSLPGVDVQDSDSSGSRILLSPATFETAGRYRCEVSGEGPLFATVSDYADMFVVDPPHHGPVISGLHKKYHLGDRVQVNCTSGRSHPACQLQWYINGEPMPAKAALPPIHEIYDDNHETSTIVLDFKLTEPYFRKKIMNVKCLAMLSTFYWQSNDKSVSLGKEKIRGRILPNIQSLNSKADVNINFWRTFAISSWNTICYTWFIFILIY